MHELQVFEDEEFGQIRTTQDENGNILFCGSDVTKALEYSNSRKALLDHCKGVTKRDTLTNGGNQVLSFIPEPDLYRLIVKSKLPTAEKFEKFVFETILPSIRKYGGYITQTKLADIFENPKNLTIFLKQMLHLSEENLKLQNTIAILEPKAQYFDNIVDGNLLVNFRTTAKEMGIKPMFFIGFLLDRKYLYRDAKQVLNPYQKHIENGLFQMKEYINHGHVGTQTLITPNGRDHFLDLFIKGEIPPVHYMEDS